VLEKLELLPSPFRRFQGHGLYRRRYLEVPLFHSTRMRTDGELQAEEPYVESWCMSRQFLRGEEKHSIKSASTCSFTHYICVTARFHPGRYSLTILGTRSIRCWTVLTSSRTREASKAQLLVLARYSWRNQCTGGSNRSFILVLVHLHIRVC
jgi:hypothetical protein